MYLLLLRLKLHLKQKKTILTIILFAICLNLFLYFYIMNTFPQFAYDGDTRWSAIGENLYKYGHYSYSPSDPPTMEAPPVFSYFYYALFSLSGNIDTGYEFMRVILILMNIGIVIVTFYIGNYVNYKVGCISALLTACDLKLFRWANNYIVPDIFCAFFMVLSLFFLIKFLKEMTIRSITICALMLGVAYMTRTGNYLLWIPISVFLAIYLFMGPNKHRIQIKPKLINLSIFVMVPILLITGWKIRNYVSIGSFEFSSQRGSVMMLNVAFLKAYQKGTNVNEEERLLYEQYWAGKTWKNEGIRSSELTQEMMPFILTSPIDYSIVVWKGIRRLLYEGDHWSDMLLAKQSVRNIVYHLSLLGFLFLLLDRQSHWVLLSLILYITYIFATHSPSAMMKYSAPIVPIIYILSAYALFFLWRYFRKLLLAGNHLKLRHRETR